MAKPWLVKQDARLICGRRKTRWCGYLVSIVKRDARLMGRGWESQANAINRAIKYNNSWLAGLLPVHIYWYWLYLTSKRIRTYATDV